MQKFAQREAIYDILQESEIESFLSFIKTKSPFFTARDRVALILLILFRLDITDLAGITIEDLIRLKLLKQGDRFEIKNLKVQKDRFHCFTISEKDILILDNYNNDFTLLFAKCKYNYNTLFIPLSREYLSFRFKKYLKQFNAKKEN